MAYKTHTWNNKVPILNFPIKLDIGAGKFKKPGFISIDFAVHESTDIVWDLTNGIPLPDNSVSEIYTSHCLEHLTPVDIHYVLLEIFRVCIDGATVEIIVPYAKTQEGGLPGHYSKLDETFINGIGIWIHDETKGKWEKERIDVVGYNLIGIFKIHKQALK
jgi:ubiquinone/menaquinone biosynthesis C-methylase UbiE